MGTEKAAAYSQYLHYGGKLIFGDFFSLDSTAPESLLSADDVNYQAIIEVVTSESGTRPFVYILPDIFSFKQIFLRELSEFAGCDQVADSLMSRGTKNKGQKRAQGEWLRKCNSAGADSIRN